MTTTNIIRIKEQQPPSTESQPYKANLIFNHRTHYSCQIRDPFANETQQEKELEWDFEEYLTFPHQRARAAART